MSQVLEILESQSLITPTRVPRTEPGTSSLDEQNAWWNQVALDMVADSVLFFSVPSMRLVGINRATCDHLGYSQHQLKRMSILQLVSQAERRNVAESIDRFIRGNLPDMQFRTSYCRQDGARWPVDCSFRVLRRPPNGLLVAVARKISEHDESNPLCCNGRYRDHLTGLPNRSWFVEQLERDVLRARNGDYQYAVLFADVDRFKDVNDSFGHVAGDEVLQAVARRLSASVRPGDVVARYGGDEFVVLMSNVRCSKSVRRIAERIGHSVVADGMQRDGEQSRAQVTVSLGAAICGGRCSSALAAIDRADRAMYRAKSLGRSGQFVVDDLIEGSQGVTDAHDRALQTE
jgi:diguanylate cyclase (GGDEF)-like protein/PAS domain S-box-containing protein